MESAALNGITIFYERHGDGPPLLLLHGFTGYGRDWRHVFPDPIDGYTTIQPDLRGHGQTLNPGGEFTFRQVALDTFALLDHLGIDRVKAIGMSLGANTLLHMATQQPERVEAMVLVSTTPYFPAGSARHHGTVFLRRDSGSGARYPARAAHWRR